MALALLDFPRVQEVETGFGAKAMRFQDTVLGGLLISDEVVDLFLPVRFFWVRRARWLKLEREGRLNHQKSEQKKK